MIHRKDKMFFAIKGGSNNEPHNHNDVGSFVAAIDGEIILADLGAGAYTKGYFGSERYTYNHTRSYWHSVPLINKCEQEENQLISNVVKYNIQDDSIEFDLELSNAYPSVEINNFYRKIKFENNKGMFTIEDSILGEDITLVNEGFISYIKPEVTKVGEINWSGTNGNIILLYDCSIFDYFIEEEKVTNHYNEVTSIYRLGLISCNKYEDIKAEFKFYYEFI